MVCFCRGHSSPCSSPKILKIQEYVECRYRLFNIEVPPSNWKNSGKKPQFLSNFSGGTPKNAIILPNILKSVVIYEIY